MRKNILSALLVLVTISTFIGFGASPLSAARPNDADALAGATSGKAIFDINVGSPQKITRFLTVIKQTHQDLLMQGVQPEFVVAFRGPSVRLITTENWSFEEKDQEELKAAAGLIHELSQEGVKLEACSVATGLFKVDNKTILPDVKSVGNTFVSLIGYQSKGFVLIPVQ